MKSTDGAHNRTDMFTDDQYDYHRCLEPAFSTADVISSLAQQVEIYREQLRVLAACIDAMLKRLNTEYHLGRLSENDTSMAIEDLNRFVNVMIVDGVSLIKG